MKIGVQLPIFTSQGDDLREFIEEVDSLGFDSLWLGDHLVLPAETRSPYPYQWRFEPRVEELFPNKNFLEALTTAAFIAGVSRRLEVGIGVLVLPMRNSVALAKELASLDVVTGGRILVGTGAGWLREEFDALGIPFDERGPRYDEALGVLTALWGQQPVSYRGRFYEFSDMHCEPRPVTPGGPPLWVGGHTSVALRRCAQYGSGWHAVELSPDDFAVHSAKIDDLLGTYGRHPEEVVRSIGRRFNLGSLKGEEESSQLIAEYRDRGCDHIVSYATPSRSNAENLARARTLAKIVGLG